jgi:hypothetical protein
MPHPYIGLEGTRLWTAAESAINDLVLNNDLIESTARPYIVGYLCQKLLNERQAVAEGMTLRSETITSNNLAEVEWTKVTSSSASSKGFRLRVDLCPLISTHVRSRKLTGTGGCFPVATSSAAASLTARSRALASQIVDSSIANS